MMPKEERVDAQEWEEARLQYYRRNIEPTDIELALLKMLGKAYRPCPYPPCTHFAGTKQHLATHVDSKHKDEEIPGNVSNMDRLLSIAEVTARGITPVDRTPNDRATPYSRQALGSSPDPTSSLTRSSTGTAPRASARPRLRGSSLIQQPLRGHLQQDDLPLEMQWMPEDHMQRMVLTGIDLAGQFTAPVALSDDDQEARNPTSFQGDQPFSYVDGTGGVPFGQEPYQGQYGVPGHHYEDEYQMSMMAAPMSDFGDSVSFSGQQSGPSSYSAPWQDEDEWQDYHE